MVKSRLFLVLVASVVIAVAAFTAQEAIATNAPLTVDQSYAAIDTLHAQRTFAGTVDNSYASLDALHAQRTFAGTDNSYAILDALHAHRPYR